MLSYEWFPLLVGELCGLSATQEISLSITVAELPYGNMLQLPSAYCLKALKNKMIVIF